ncbi:MAG TPA: histidine kinase [Pyrinomonadaceae bacterium]|nr:histidine kinase [Pyrinomonadaceae bacterium]
MSTEAVQPGSFKIDPLSERWIDLRLVSGSRLLLAGAGLLVTVVDTEVGSKYIPLITTLTLYTVYSAVVLLLSIRKSHGVPVQYLHWVDMIWFVILIGLNNTSNNIFFSYFFFAILVASFGWGYLSGLRITLVSTLVVMTVGLLTLPNPDHVELKRLLLRPIELLILGFLISRWGGFKVNLRDRLQLLKDVTVQNTRFGTDRTITSIMESLRNFFDADACLLLIPVDGNASNSKYQIYRVRRGPASGGSAPVEVGEDAAQMFLHPSPNHAVIYRKQRKGGATFVNVHSRDFSRADPSVCDRIATTLDTTNYLSTPVHTRNQPMGRLYVIGSPQTSDHTLVDFVLQLMDHVTPLIENMRLVDSLASYAADEERRRIARDIHDSVIQPYVGLQLGIAALAQKLKSGNDKVVDNVQELLELTNQELVELRRYVWGLRAGEERRDVLLPAIERFTSRFSSVTGIKVDVNAHGKIEINDRVAAELFQMVTEGLSNVRRHALCNDAQVDLTCRNGKFVLQIKNPRPPVTQFEPEDGHDHQKLFTPRSISERAAMLGGKTAVTIDKQNHTVVSVTIPL